MEKPQSIYPTKATDNTGAGEPEMPVPASASGEPEMPVASASGEPEMPVPASASGTDTDFLLSTQVASNITSSVLAFPPPVLAPLQSFFS